VFNEAGVQLGQLLSPLHFLSFLDIDAGDLSAHLRADESLIDRFQFARCSEELRERLWNNLHRAHFQGIRRTAVVVIIFRQLRFKVLDFFVQFGDLSLVLFDLSSYGFFIFISRSTRYKKSADQDKCN
jgi:hypothetical protein